MLGFLWTHVTPIAGPAKGNRGSSLSFLCDFQECWSTALFLAVPPAPLMTLLRGMLCPKHLGLQLLPCLREASDIWSPPLADTCLLGEQEVQQSLPRMGGKCTTSTRHRKKWPSVPKLVTEMNKADSALFLLELFHVQRMCWGLLSLGGCHAPTQLLLYSCSAIGQGNSRRFYCHRENRLELRKMNLYYWLLIIQQHNEQQT